MLVYMYNHEHIFIYMLIQERPLSVEQRKSEITLRPKRGRAARGASGAISCGSL